jgi:eukaryotic-like serine/threonine-protein kinase
MRYSPGDCVDGRYEIRSLLGEGGMAEVYHAVDGQTGREVVLKLPHLAISGDLTAFRRYRHEMQIAHGLDHPGLQRLLSPPGAPYMVLEYVEGESLRTYLAQHGPLTVEQVRSIGVQLAHTLEYVHTHGIIHRDIKPENILIRPPEHVTLTDFGIAARMGASRWWRVAQLSNAVGTPDYMAPEQVRGQPADARTDVYALGSVLYELLTGEVPYPARAATQIPLVRRLRPDVPVVLEAVLHRAVRRRLEERYPSMAALAQDLEHLELVAVPSRYAADVPPPKPIGDLPPLRTVLVLVLVVLLALLAVGAFAQMAHHAAPH